VLETLLAQEGQCLAFEPPHFGASATVGGMVAAGLAGPSRAQVGGVRDHVLGAQLINGLGESLTFGGQVMKNVAGYDVSRVLAGSMGCLGVVTEVSLKVLPQAPAEATIVCHLNQAQALQQLHRWGAQALPLNASAWLHDTHSQPAADCLFVRLRGAAAAVEAACPRMVADVQALGGTAQRMDNAQAARDWQAGCEQTLPFFTALAPDLCLWRLSLPQTAPVLDLPYADCVGCGPRRLRRTSCAKPPMRRAVMPPCFAAPQVLSCRCPSFRRCQAYSNGFSANCNTNLTPMGCSTPAV
jgi:glycolate oxidase FAD binding subunit